MRIVDANVLLYAVNAASERHSACRRWLDDALSGADTVGLAWVPLLAFVRLTTKHGLFPAPLSADDAMRQVTESVQRTRGSAGQSDSPACRCARGPARQGRRGGNLVNDAHLAALAIEHRARIVSYDSDFGRFDDVRCDTPEALQSSR